jgi:hypothetical protein
LDEQSGNLFSGDSFGSNSPIIPDALWMQFSRASLDVYLAAIKNCRANFHGKVKHVMTGHNDRPLTGEKYLDNLEQAVQSLMDKGDAVLVPSYRPAGLQQIVIGDRMQDPDWVAVNVDKEHYLPAPVDKIAGLTRVGVAGATLSPAFTPGVKDYVAKVPHGAAGIAVTVEPTSTRSAALTINGETVKPGQSHTVRLTGTSSPMKIRVSSPDGTVTAEYTITVSSQ